jgi:hypothetical protein
MNGCLFALIAVFTVWAVLLTAYKLFGGGAFILFIIAFIFWMIFDE